MRILGLLAALLGLTGVALGAFAAHGLKAYLAPESLEVFTTGVHYQMMHALAVLALVGVYQGIPDKKLIWAGRWMVVGVLLFSGSLYLLATTSIRWFGPITPLGGVGFLIGWALVALTFLKSTDSRLNR
ncbi:DUF423 domain-containing protein [Vibrio ulleungensis]|uniref:DUF423 domain-containing protein n=1 Tax=Vibrio ulleungensis TaxID=2807619 RepID=A0ABS2HD52_9VIBR|nr:DUF423 domain-containing protein [Vibrio ulleungensis]MBM7035508.1 DUF423 domain-containing protein [Vibrio ulleungensis]